MTTSGLNVIEMNAAFGSTLGYYDDFTLSAGPTAACSFTPAPVSASVSVGGGEGNLLALHPTVKPVDLMRWLCRLVIPPGGVVLDPFMGSGSTGVAAKLEGFRFIGIEKDVESLEVAKRRLEWAVYEPGLFDEEATP